MVYTLSTAERPSLEVVGGKARSLIDMAAAGLPVPPGFVLDVGFFGPWIATLTATAEWDRLVTALDEGKDLADPVQNLQDVCAGLEFTTQQRRQLKDGTATLPDASPVAVRSSSPEEDLLGASFAGGYTTVLGVATDDVEHAVRTCFASAVDERVLVYKKQHGYDVRRPRIAVFVQHLVDADVAGVAFSVNPLTNDMDEAVVDANWGLGQTVVSGAVEADHFVIDTVTGAVIERRLGSKRSQLRPRDGGGVDHVAASRGGEYCLDDGALMRLVDLLGRSEEVLGRPVDIEFAFRDDQLYLLQARPITGVVPVHPSMRTAPGERRILYFDAALNKGVTTNRPMSALTLSWLFELMPYVYDSMGVQFRRSRGDAAARADADPHTSWLFAAGGRYYTNLSKALVYLHPKLLAWQMRTVDALAGELLDQVDRDRYVAAGTGGLPTLLVMVKAVARGGWRARSSIANTVHAIRAPQDFLVHYHRVLDETIEELRADVDPNSSLDDLVRRHGTVLARAWAEASMPALFAYFLTLGRLGLLFRRADPDTAALVDQIRLGFAGDEAVAIGVELYGLSQLLDPADFEDLDRLAARFSDGSLPAPVQTGWSRFVRRHGHRGPGELELSNARYGDDARLAVEQMDSMLGSTTNPRQIQERHVTARAEAERRLAASLPARRRARFHRVVALISQMGATRDTPKYLFVLANAAFRRHALRRGRRWCDDDRLDAPEHIFDLSLPEIRSAEQDSDVDLRALRAARRHFDDQVAMVRAFPHIIDSRGRIGRVTREPDAEGRLIGTGVSRGVAVGPVKVLDSPREKRIEPGDVLVAYTTDPGWTPLFVNAAAIVLEIGSMLQHGGVVAREYGKPCVAGIQGITVTLTDGQLVEVDGTAGTVRLLDGAQG